LGETDPSIFLWAGHLAEETGDLAQALMLYTQACSLEGRAGQLAPLYLARLHLREGRAGQASEVLRKHLDRRPEDAPARALLAVARDRAE